MSGPLQFLEHYWRCHEGVVGGRWPVPA
ncbi:unnamed protein product [Callosobruchus maculatus]|uniref:Uncharacterized protein n=1 Tax=Callosobruchus maculatus TaxID=64391 RepID=A0A653DUH7_CALMS|nr:unnamed protein product [Callosobruchus maculatus]